jgi:glutamyl/glutaminyl-tRNA synthetase
VTEVVRGDDLLPSTRQIHLQRLLGYDTPVCAHVPRSWAPTKCASQRHGAVTSAGWPTRCRTDTLLSVLAASLGIGRPGDAATMRDVVAGFAWTRVPRQPFTWSDDLL